MNDLLRSVTLLLVLLNPFLLIVYLIDIVKKKSQNEFGRILFRAGIISFLVFSAFAILGDAIFSSVFHSSFASFQIFGGIIFLITGIHFIFKGSASIESLRGESKHIVGAIAMPIFIGPGTISYCIIIGERMNKLGAIISIFSALIICISIIILLKIIHDKIHMKKAELIEQYIDISGRVIALILGMVSIELIMNGIFFWINTKF